MLHCALPALPEPLERLAAASRPAVAKGLRIWLDDCARSRELCLNLGDGVNQAANLASSTTSIPSRNLAPLTIFGNWF
jgi:hypothetical protein